MRQLLATACLIVLIQIGFIPACCSQVTLPVVNSGFEAGSPTNPPSGWTVAAGSNPLWIGDAPIGNANPGAAFEGNNFISGSWEHSGLGSADSLIGGAQNSGLIYQDIDLTPHNELISQGDRLLGLSYAFYNNDGNDFGSVSYEFYDASNSLLGSNSYVTQASGAGWQLVDNPMAGVVPATSTRLRISVGAGLNPGSFGSARNVAFDAIGANLLPPPPPDEIGDIVHGNLIQFDSDGNWTWYTDERSIVNPNNGHVLVNSVGFDETVQGGGYPGNVDVVSFDPVSGRRVRTRLSNQVEGNPAIQNDDHNVGALLVLPDGRYLATYANHGNNGGLGDEWTRYRVSTNPGDSTSWSEERLFNWYDNVPGADQTGNPDQGNISYHNLFYLADEGKVYDISRSYGRLSTNGAGQNMPNVAEYHPDSNTLEWKGQFLESDAQGYSAYPKYASDGESRIYFTTTETHPRNYNNSVFAGFIEGGQTFDMRGNLIDANLFDSNVTAGDGAVPDVTDFTLVAAPDGLGEGHNRLWTTDAALDSQGNLMALYTSRWNTDGSANDGGTENPIDHRLHFARWDPNSESWSNQEIARMGDRLYGPEQDYTGLGALIPGDENTLYISTPFDPRDPTWQTETRNHEIYRGNYDGSKWNWQAITEDSTVDNLRPIAPDTHGTGPQPVFWFRGDYTTAHNINAAVVGIIDRPPHDQSGLVTYVDADASNTTRLDGSAIGATAPSDLAGPDDDLWHQRSGIGNGGSVYSSNESGTEDAAMLRTTLTGLADGTYDLYAYFWSDNDEDWRLLAGLEENNLIDFRKYGSQHANSGQFDHEVEVSASANDLLLYRAYLGRSEVADGADLQVFIDDWQTLNGAASRTWFDGVGYSLVGPSLPGDFNRDGLVDAADYTVWRDSLGANDLPPYTGGDANGDGQVTQADYRVWADTFGQSLADPAHTSQAPEPTGGVLLLPFVLLSRRRRNQPRRASAVGPQGLRARPID